MMQSSVIRYSGRRYQLVCAIAACLAGSRLAHVADGMMIFQALYNAHATHVATDKKCSVSFSS